ncbi:hypothetical protein LNO88_20255 [Klebsiella pneumoniae subsp. pneumoniae]|nr:hypothetical protein [Klebsiella pneumoniae subsp. pneumoniae]
MTKLGFVAKGMVENRTKAKRRKAPVSLGTVVLRGSVSGSVVVRGTATLFVGEDGNVMRVTAVHGHSKKSMAVIGRQSLRSKRLMLRKSI